MDEVDERIDLERALERLPAKQRKALILWAQGYTQEEIADKFGITQPAVHYLMQNALGQLLIKLP